MKFLIVCAVIIAAASFAYQKWGPTTELAIHHPVSPQEEKISAIAAKHGARVTQFADAGGGNVTLGLEWSKDCATCGDETVNEARTQGILGSDFEVVKKGTEVNSMSERVNWGQYQVSVK